MKSSCAVRKGTLVLVPFIAATVLTACGGGRTTDSGFAQTSPNSSQITTVSRELHTDASFAADVTYDAATDTITKSEQLRETFTIGRAADQGTIATTGYVLYENSFVEVLPGGAGLTRTFDVFGLRGETASGGGSATLIGAPAQDGGYTGFDRLSATELPTSGPGSYTGEYLGGVAAITGFKEFTYIQGNVVLNADFANAQISGLITDRIDTGGDTYADIVL